MRWKLLIGNLIAVLLVGVVGWRLALSNAAAALVVDIDPSVDRGVELLAAVRDQAGDALLDAVEVSAASPELAAVFAQQSETGRRDAAFAFAEQQARARVVRALEQLTAEQRAAIELMYFRGLSQSETATELGVALGTLKSRVRAAMERLGDLLDEGAVEVAS